MSLKIEIKVAEEDIIGEHQVGSKEAYHGLGNDIPIMDDYVKFKKGERYIVVTTAGWEDFARELHEWDAQYVLHDVMYFLEDNKFDMMEIMKLIDPLRAKTIEQEKHMPDGYRG